MKNFSYFADFGSKNRPYTGGYYFAEQLLYILKELNVNLTIFSAIIPKIDKGANLIKSDDIIKIELPIGGFGNPLVGLKWISQLKKELKNLPKQDLYIFDQPNTLINFLPKVPSIAMFHGSDFVKFSDLSIFHPRDLLFGLFWRKLFLNKIHKQFLLKKIGTPLFNSEDTLNNLAKDFNVDSESLRQNVVYLPIDNERFKRDENERIKIREQFGIKNNEIAIISLSNFDPVKRADRLSSIIIKMLTPTLKVGVGIKFLLIGGGRMSKPIDELSKNSSVSNKIIRIREVSHNDVHKFYSAADVALSTSERESFGYFIAEGMSCELPFVAYCGGAIKEVIENNKTGFVVDDENNFINKLLELINNENLRQKMGEAGRKRIIKMFSIEVFKKRLLRVISDIIKYPNTSHSV